MSKSNLYTRTGDRGTTSLVGGTRVAKNCSRLEAYGTLDELSAALGMIISEPDCPEGIRETLHGVQNMLFNLGGYLACESPSAAECAAMESTDALPPAWGLREEHIRKIEECIDTLDSATPKVNAFVLPGGCRLSAEAHLARTVCRRAERRILDLASENWVDAALIEYINRLSDYLFILARYFNHISGVEELTWRKED